MSRIDQRTQRMLFHRTPKLASMLVAVTIVSASVAFAQSWPQGQQQQSSAWPQSNPAPQSGPRPQSNPWQRQQQQQQQSEPKRDGNPCSGFLPMKSDAEKTVVAINAAQKKKAPREEFCHLFKRLSDATGKMLRFFEEKKAQCGVPSEAIVAVRTDHSRSLTLQKQACSSGPPPGAAPSLSDVLSSPILPDSSVARPNMGTFETLTGNPLIR